MSNRSELRNRVLSILKTTMPDFSKDLKRINKLEADLEYIQKEIKLEAEYQNMMYERAYINAQELTSKINVAMNGAAKLGKCEYPKVVRSNSICKFSAKRHFRNIVCPNIPDFFFCRIHAKTFRNANDRDFRLEYLKEILPSGRFKR